MNAPISNPKSAEKAEREERQGVSLDAYAQLPDGSMIRVTVLDLTYDGCKVETPVALLKGLKLTISVLRLGAFSAEVRWYADGCAGLKFNGKEETAQRKMKPREERLPIAAELSLRKMGRPPYQAKVFDFSPSGCRVEFVERPREGEQVWVKFDGLDSIEAEVRWVDGFYGGIAFKRAIYPAVFELLLSRIRR